MKIVSGRTGSPHVTSQQFRQMLEGILGQDSYILTSGENLKPELSSNNLLKIRSGMMCHHGCISCVEIGTYDEVTLTNGSHGMQRIDLVVNRYTRNTETEVEKCEWKVITGTAKASSPAVPTYTKGNLQEGDLVDECPVFEIHYNGINVTEVKSLLNVVKSAKQLSNTIDNNYTQFYNQRIAKEIHHLPTTSEERYSMPVSAGSIIPFPGGLIIPTYSKGMYVCNGGEDAAIIMVDVSNNLYVGFRNKVNWTGRKI